MLMRHMKKEFELEKAQTKSLLVVAATFVFANMFLLVGFTQIANAQSVSGAQHAVDLARMLAAPDLTSGLGLPVSRGAVFGVMSTALIIMTASSVAFFRGFADNVNRAGRTKF